MNLSELHHKNSSAALAEVPQSRDAARLPWIDNLRSLMIVLVVNLHACVSYSHVGDWYFMSAQEPTLNEKLPFILWQAHLQSFFMGLLFFIFAYFAHGALARRGSAGFVRERLLRLGVPALLYMLVIHPFILLVLNPWQHDFGAPAQFYLAYVGKLKFLSGSGPLWFAFALLIFCLVLAAWRQSTPSLSKVVQAKSDTPSAGQICRFAILLGLASFAVRLVQPIGTNIMNMQLCFFVQYIAFFVAGLHAARHGWLATLAASAQARRAGWLALVTSPIVLLALIVLGAKTAPPGAFFGGWHWQALAYAVWEQAAGVAISLGLLALFARKFNRENRVSRWLADRSFGVFVLHAPVIIALGIVFRSLPQNMYLLTMLLTASGLVLSFGLVHFARRLPGLQRIL